PKKDPLYGYGTEDLWAARMAELGWCLAQNPGGYPAATVCGVEDVAAASAPPPPFPTSTLCHAMTYGIDWRGPDADYESAVPTGQPKLAMGNTSTEALSALIASMVPAPR